jgi:hypothetical protein
MMEVNWISIGAAGVSAMAVGFLWYGPLFGKTWIKLTGKSEAELMKNAKNMIGMYATTFVAALVQAYVLSVFLDLANVTDTVSAIQITFWAWLGFTAATMWSNYLFSGKSTNLYLFDAVYFLVSLGTMAAVLVNVG